MHAHTSSLMSDTHLHTSQHNEYACHHCLVSSILPNENTQEKNASEKMLHIGQSLRDSLICALICIASTGILRMGLFLRDALICLSSESMLRVRHSGLQNLEWQGLSYIHLLLAEVHVGLIRDCEIAPNKKAVNTPGPLEVIYDTEDPHALPRT